MWQEHLYPEAERALARLNKESDRAAAIIAGTMVEYHTTKAVRARLHKIQSNREFLFDPARSGPLSSFRVKAELCNLTGILGFEPYRELVTLVKIRNKFAHKLEITTFQSDEIKKQCKSLSWFERHIEDRSDKKFEAARKRWLEGKGPPPTPKFAAPTIGFSRLKQRLKVPRQRFLICAQVFCVLLAYAPEVPPSPPSF